MKASPAYLVKASTSPGLPASLDLCTDETCKSIKGSVTLTCAGRSDSASNLVLISECDIDAAKGREPAFSLLQDPADLHLRIDAVTSDPFHYTGISKDMPKAIYSFSLAANGSSLAVTSQ